MGKKENKQSIISSCQTTSLEIVEHYSSTRKPVTVYCKRHNVNSTHSGDMAVKLVKKDLSLCNVCRKIHVRNNNIELTDDQYVAFAKHQHNNLYDYKLPLSLNKDKITVICKVHGEFQTRKSAHISPTQLYGCQKCKVSKGELQISKYLDFNNIEYTIEKQFPNLTGVNGITPLRYDFYLPELNTIIEFDGVHHFYPKKFGTRQTDEEQKQYKKRVRLYDIFKNGYAILNDIKLIRIPYTEIDKINEILDKELSK